MRSLSFKAKLGSLISSLALGFILYPYYKELTFLLVLLMCFWVLIPFPHSKFYRIIYYIIILSISISQISILIYIYIFRTQYLQTNLQFFIYFIGILGTSEVFGLAIYLLSKKNKYWWISLE